MDRMGLNSKPALVIWFIGWINDPAILDDKFLSTYKYSWVSHVLNKLKNSGKSIDVLWLTSQSILNGRDMGATINYAEQYIKNNKSKYSQIMLLWHSLWGDNSVVLSNKLNNDGIDVDLLVTIDIKSVYENDTVESNVKKAVNYYQTNQWFPSWEDLETAWFNDTTDLTNILYNTSKDWTSTSHESIDNDLEDDIYQLILSTYAK